jgi:hypothetical protein
VVQYPISTVLWYLIRRTPLGYSEIMNLWLYCILMLMRLFIIIWPNSPNTYVIKRLIEFMWMNNTTRYRKQRPSLIFRNISTSAVSNWEEQHKPTTECSVFVMKTNLTHSLSLIYFVNQPLHVSGMFIAHHQEGFTVYIQQLGPVIRLNWLAAGIALPSSGSFPSAFWDMLNWGAEHAHPQYSID